MPMQYPAPRKFTQADGRIDFRACLAAARDFLAERRHHKLYATNRHEPRTFKHEIIDAVARVGGLVTHEAKNWAPLSPTQRAAATHFDSLVSDCRDAYGRDLAIEAIILGRPVVWSTSRNPIYLDGVNGGVDRAYSGGATIFEVIVADWRTHVDEYFALNDAGAAFLRNVRAARAYRRRPLQAA